MVNAKETPTGDFTKIGRHWKTHSVTGHMGRAHKYSTTSMDSHRPTGPHQKGLCPFYSPHMDTVSARPGTDTHQVFSSTPENTFVLASVHMHGWGDTHVGELLSTYTKEAQVHTDMGCHSHRSQTNSGTKPGTLETGGGRRHESL